MIIDPQKLGARLAELIPHIDFDARVDVVQRLGVRRQQLDAETCEVLQAAYAAGGVTWTQLGAALGVTGSVAWHLAHPSGTAEEARLTGI